MVFKPGSTGIRQQTPVCQQSESCSPQQRERSWRRSLWDELTRTQNSNSDLGKTLSRFPTSVPLDPTLGCHRGGICSWPCHRPENSNIKGIFFWFPIQKKKKLKKIRKEKKKKKDAFPQIFRASGYLPTSSRKLVGCHFTQLGTLWSSSSRGADPAWNEEGEGWDGWNNNCLVSPQECRE